MKKIVKIPAAILLTCLSASMFANVSNQSTKDPGIGRSLEQSNTSDYWTPDRLKNAQEMPMPRADLNNVKKIPFDQLERGKSESGEGALPDKDISMEAEQLFDASDESGTDLPNGDKPIPNNSGTYSQYFSSSQLVPITADTTYPYRAVGKLFFTIPGQGDFVCSASVLRPRVVLTAGHCTHKGSAGVEGFYTNFYFIPAYRDGSAPLQTWYPSYVQTTSAWASGGGGVPNAADYAMFQMVDKTINNSKTKIGSVTGYLGYQTQALSPNHATLLGYPCNLDRCAKMHQVAARSGSAVSPNNVEYGSDMRGGSSGGPWVQNFGAASVGQTGGTNSNMNRVIGITSYGYVSTDPKVQGSSIPDSRFISVLNVICGLQTGNC